MQLIAAEKSCSGFIRIDLGYDGLALQTAMEAVARLREGWFDYRKKEIYVAKLE